jgi:hypothetical protein
LRDSRFLSCLAQLTFKIAAKDPAAARILCVRGLRFPAFKNHLFVENPVRKGIFTWVMIKQDGRWMFADFHESEFVTIK